MHADQGISDIETGIRPDSQNRHRVFKPFPGSSGQGTAGLDPRYYPDDFITIAFGGFPFHDQRTVQVLAALESRGHAGFTTYFHHGFHHCFSIFIGGVMADGAAGDLTGTAADDQQFYRIKMRPVFLKQSGDSLLRLRRYLFCGDTHNGSILSGFP